MGRSFTLLAKIFSANQVLRSLGATVGVDTHIYADVRFINVQNWNFQRLFVGNNVYIGPRCLFDLTDDIRIEDHCSIAAQVTMITHLNVGTGPLSELVPKRSGAILVRRGAWIGVNTTLLYGTSVGECSMVGAMSLVNKSVPAYVLAFGIPCSIQKTLPQSKTSEQINPTQTVSRVESD